MKCSTSQWAKDRQRQGGMAIIELTLCLPILLLLMLGTAELGRLYIHYNALTKAVHSGARYLAANARNNVNGPVSLSATGNRQQAINLVVYGTTVPGTSAKPRLPGFTTNDVQVVGAPTSIQVQASYTYAPFNGGDLPAFGLGSLMNLKIPLRASVNISAL